MKKILLGLFALTAFLSFNAQVTIVDDGSGTGTTTWTSDNVYILDGFVFVNEGQTLTIEAGTVIKGKPGTGADASALIVARGATIIANGTEENPIIMTFEADALDGSTPYTTNGQWGGLIVLGDASLNSVPGETQIEGIPETEPRGLYGGENDMDSSGSIKYVSVRHGGTDIGAGNEINGITLGGVGSETVIEHVEVFANADDGIEFFGGTAEVKWASIAFCGDDSFDYDEGWRGKGQFWFTVQDPNGEGNGDRGGEHDGGTDPEDGMPYATPTIYNVTYVGRGIDAGKRALTFRDNAGGEYHNGIFVNWGKGIDVENLSSGEDSYNQLTTNGNLAFAGNIFYDVAEDGTDATAEDLFKITMGTGGWTDDADSLAQLSASAAEFAMMFDDLGNEVMNPGLDYAEVDAFAFALDLVPANDVDGGSAPSDDFYDAVTYRGAFEPNTTNLTWLENWSYIDNLGFLVDPIISVDENTEASILTYPNPVSDQFTLEVQEELVGAQINVYNAVGQIVSTSRINAPRTVVSMNEMTRGVYTVQIISEQYNYSKQIIKE